jgi:hypothetical protein
MSNTVQSSPHFEDVSRRAYEIWEKNGRPDGNEQEHWYVAERELMQTGVPSIAAQIANDPVPQAAAAAKSKARVKR